MYDHWSLYKIIGNTYMYKVRETLEKTPKKISLLMDNWTQTSIYYFQNAS